MEGFQGLISGHQRAEVLFVEFLAPECGGATCNCRGEETYSIVTVSFTNNGCLVNQVRILGAKLVLLCHLTIRLTTASPKVEP